MLLRARVVLRSRRAVVFSRRISSRVLLVCLDFRYLLHRLLAGRNWNWRERNGNSLGEEDGGLLGGLACSLGLFELLEFGGLLLLLEQLLLPFFALSVEKTT